jgi:poly-gamma-glutamate synthesis protein (capsule biosynthesis protein)
MTGSFLAVVGDLMVRTPGVTRRYRDDAGFQAVREALSSAAVAVANLELPLSRRGHQVPKTVNLRADPAVIEDLLALGVDAVTLANNHMMDFGPEAMLDTLATCDEAGLVHCGAGSDLDAALAPAWLTAGERRMALLSVACTLPIESDATPGKPGIAPLRTRFAFEVDLNLLAEQPGSMPTVQSWAVPEDQARVAAAIVACREQGADDVVVAIHWGSPSYWLSPAQGLLCAYQRPLAHALIDAGADAVCGVHAHQLHPIEVFRGKPILYCLGNVLFEGLGDYPFLEPEAVIARLTFGDAPACELVPLLLDRHGFPRRATGEDAARIIARLNELSRPFGTEIVDRDGIGSVALA